MILAVSVEGLKIIISHMGGNMNVYIGNIPDDVVDYDLRRLFKPVVGAAGSFKVVEKRLNDGIYRYGFADIEPQKLALEAIGKFNGTEFRGRRLIVREFLHRSYSNERRAIDWRQKPWHKDERRDSERRGSGYSL